MNRDSRAGEPPSATSTFRLEDAVYLMADAMRSLGLEEGTDLMLQLVYVWWATARDQREGGWQSLHEELMMSRNPSRADAISRLGDDSLVALFEGGSHRRASSPGSGLQPTDCHRGG